MLSFKELEQGHHLCLGLPLFNLFVLLRWHKWCNVCYFLFLKSYIKLFRASWVTNYYLLLVYRVACCRGKLIFLDHLYVIQDHAGHIFGVDSTPMIEKLEQYNAILEVCLLNIFTQILHFSLVNSLSLFSCNSAWHTSSCNDNIFRFLNL